MFSISREKIILTNLKTTKENDFLLETVKETVRTCTQYPVDGTDSQEISSGSVNQYFWKRGYFYQLNYVYYQLSDNSNINDYTKADFYKSYMLSLQTYGRITYSSFGFTRKVTFLKNYSAY